jgi:hypothetical protein
MVITRAGIPTIKWLTDSHHEFYIRLLAWHFFKCLIMCYNLKEINMDIMDCSLYLAKPVSDITHVLFMSVDLIYAEGYR